MKYISSEREIINSEHEKNILDDMWIMDDVFKNFYTYGSKYKKFGTGNNKSLEGITKEYIFKYYYKYYTTDNIFKTYNILYYMYIFTQCPLSFAGHNFAGNTMHMTCQNLEAWSLFDFGLFDRQFHGEETQGKMGHKTKPFSLTYTSTK